MQNQKTIGTPFKTVSFLSVNYPYPLAPCVYQVRSFNVHLFQRYDKALGFLLQRLCYRRIAGLPCVKLEIKYFQVYYKELDHCVTMEPAPPGTVSNKYLSSPLCIYYILEAKYFGSIQLPSGVGRLVNFYPSTFISCNYHSN